jgi:hypothetical protein
MIETFADLLESTRRKEKEIIDALGLRHRPTIGNTYEGLTDELLQKALFTGLNLNVVKNSFIIDDNGNRSDEMDILLIEGEGVVIPYTEHQYDVKFEQVIAVIQVKKRLNKAQLGEAFENLKGVNDFFDEHNVPSFSRRIFRDAYRGIAQEDIIEDGRYRKTFQSTTTENIYHVLNVEAAMPARIVFGYEGYSSEYGLREGFFKFLMDNKSSEQEMKYGYGPLNFPSLILNGEFTIIKGNGAPYGYKLVDGQWMLCVTSSDKPMLKFLEVIWTQLSYRYDLPDVIFGEDISKEGVNAYLKANMVNVNGVRAWNYEYVTLKKKTLEENSGNGDWQPFKLNEIEHHAMAYICHNVRVKIVELRKHLNLFAEGVDMRHLIDRLLESDLLYEEKGNLILLTDQCRTAFVPGYGYCTAEDKSGRFSRWTEKYMADRKLKTK